MNNTVFIKKEISLKELNNNLLISDEVDINAICTEMASGYHLKYINRTIAYAYKEQCIIVTFEFIKIGNTEGLEKRIRSGKMLKSRTISF
jgi:hypothetical protein